MKPIDALIPRANRIGHFFEALPDRAESLEDIADHIRKFWEPRMRSALLEFLDEHPDGKSEGAELSPIVLEAVTLHRQRLEPAHAIQEVAKP